MAMKVDSYRFQSKLLPLLRKLEQAQADDAVAEKKIRKAGCTGGLLFLLGIVGLFGSAFAAEAGVPALIFLVPVGLIVAAIVFFVKAARLGKFDLDNRKLECAVGLLRMLRADTPQESDLEMELDFRDYKTGGRLLDQQKASGFGGVRTFRYEHPWLSLSGSLADGTKYKLAVVETVNRKEKPKRKGRVKLKERTKAAVQLLLRPKPGKYGDVAAVAETLRQTAPKPPLSLKSVRSAGPRLAAVLETGQHVKVTSRSNSGEQGEENVVQTEALLSALLWAYDGLGRTARPGA